MNQHLSLSSSVILTPPRAGLHQGGENIIDVCVQAPDTPAGLVFAADADLSHARATA